MHSEIKLSILICTVIERKHLFKDLLSELGRQQFGLENPDEVEILWIQDNKEISVGTKRNQLLKQAKGEYVCFIDDDDWIADDYISKILAALSEGPDCVGFLIHCDMEGKEESAATSMKYKDWAENVDGFKYVRSVYQKTPVRRELALKAGFPDKRFSEDYDYSMRVTPLCKTEVFINEVMYYYRYKAEDPNKKYGLTK